MRTQIWVFHVLLRRLKLSFRIPRTPHQQLWTLTKLCHITASLAWLNDFYAVEHNSWIYKRGLLSYPGSILIARHFNCCTDQVAGIEEMEVHVISKSDNSKHASFTLETAPGELAASSVRVKVELISLTSNNLSYARGGTVLHWWVNQFFTIDHRRIPYKTSFQCIEKYEFGEVIAN